MLKTGFIENIVFLKFLASVMLPPTAVARWLRHCAGEPKDIVGSVLVAVAEGRSKRACLLTFLRTLEIPR